METIFIHFQFLHSSFVSLCLCESVPALWPCEALANECEFCKNFFECTPSTKNECRSLLFHHHYNICINFVFVRQPNAIPIPIPMQVEGRWIEWKKRKHLTGLLFILHGTTCGHVQLSLKHDQDNQIRSACYEAASDEKRVELKESKLLFASNLHVKDAIWCYVLSLMIVS